MTTVPLNPPGFQYCDNNGDPLNGGLIYTYTAGTTTNKATYTDSTGGTPNANPVVTDASGRAAIWITGTYKIVVKTSAGVTISTDDNVPSFSSGSVTATVTDAGFTIQNASDLTKQFQFLASSITTGTTTIGTLPDGNFTFASVGGVQTLTNKTLTSPVLNGATFDQTSKNNASTATTRQYLLSGSSATYTTPSGCRFISVKMWGGGGGGAASLTNSGSAGGNTIFNSINAAGGSGGTAPAAAAGSGGGLGGSGGSGSATFRMRGANGQSSGLSNSNAAGSLGGATSLGGNGYGVTTAAGTAAVANSGSGGGGGAGAGNGTAPGGGAGEYVIYEIASPSATYTYTVGAAGNGGAAGTYAGGNGGTGMIIVEEYY